MASDGPLATTRGRRGNFESPGPEAAAAALSDGGASYGALFDGNAQVELPSSSDLVGSVFARVTAATVRYLIVVEPTSDCQPRANQVAALMIDDGIDVAHSSALVKKNVKALLKTHHLVHHALLFPGRTLFLVTRSDDAVEHLVPVVIDGVDAQLYVHWSRTDDSFSCQVGEVSVNHLADFMITVDLFRDITARFPYQLPPWARLLEGDVQALNVIAGFASEDAQFQSAQLVPTTSRYQPQTHVMLDLSDTTELTAPLRQLLAGSPNLPTISEPSSWSRVEAIAVVMAAAAEMSRMGQTRCDSALAMFLAALQARGDGEAEAAAAALRPGGVLRSLSAWLQASFSPGMRLAAVEAFPVPTERTATCRRRLRQPD